MNGFDVIILLSLVLSIWLGLKQLPIRQASISAGTVGGILVALFIYDRLAFLADNSFGRTVVLALVIVTACLICYDMLLTLGTKVERQFYGAAKARKATLGAHLVSAAIAFMTVALIQWISIAVFAPVAPVPIRQQIQSSIIAEAIQDYALPQRLKSISSLLTPFASPQAFIHSEPTFNATTVSSDFSALDSAVAQASTSTFKIHAWGCGATSTGSGFMISKQAIVTNAHVIAGADRISVQDRGNSQSYVVDIILFDPQNDIAVLRTSTPLPYTPLIFDTANQEGAIASVLGYPDGAAFNDGDALVLKRLQAKGYDIYNKGVITRFIYALRADVSPGESGSALVNASGRVAGVVFGHSTTQAHTGYALTSAQVAPGIQESLKRNTTVSSGSCAS